MSRTTPAVRRVLGFDGGCAACTGLARRVERLLEGQLTARSLREPEVQAWRSEALGASAPWAPTLFEVGDGRVRAWTGWRMAWRLGRLLGPAKAAQVVRAIGEAGLPGDSAADTGRRRLLRTLGGAALGLLVVSGAKLRSPGTAVAQGGKFTAEPVDENTRADMVRRARDDSRYRRLADRLAASGFAPLTAEPVVLRGREDGQLLRTVVVTEYAAPAGGRTAALGFGVEPNGETWSHAVVRAGGKPSFGLRVGRDGRVETVQATEQQAQTASTTSCRICRALCGGLCTVGCGAACFLLCGPNILCLIGCGFICGAVCVGVCVEAACDRYCA